MMTRRKSVHESTMQAQLQLQERAAEEQLTLGALASGIANILGPSQSTHGASVTHSSPGTPGTATGTPQTLSKQATANGMETAKKSSGISPTASASSTATTSSLAGKNTNMGRSKTPRISKRSAPIDVPQTSGGNTVTNTTATLNSTVSSSTTHGAGGNNTASGPNPVQQTLAQNGMDPDEIPKFKGYRIIEIDHFLQWAAYSQFMHSKHCPGGLLKPYQEYISGCYSTFAMKCSKCSAIITRSSENYIHHNKLMNRLVKGTVQLGKDYDEMQQFMESLEVPFVTREEFQSIRGQVSSSLEDQSALQRAVEELERAASVASKRKRHGSCKYHYEVLKVYLNKKMKKIEENLQLSVNDSVALAVNAHLKNVSHVQLVPNGLTNTSANCTTITGVNGGISATTSSNSIGNLAIGTINVQSVPIATPINGSNSSNSSNSMYSSSSISNCSRSGTGNASVQLSLPEPTISGMVSGRLPPANREQHH
uniref:Mutator-like transposase domain-containing protein n=1 Tax=Anopheles funestus TaxID=62324 RepID=A0A182R4C0_ANOFN